MTTKTTSFQLIITLLVLGNCGAQTFIHERHLGEPFSRTEITSIRALTTHPEKYFNENVKVEGIIASAWTDGGYFIEIVPKDLGGESILINFPDLASTFSTDYAGHMVIVEGMFYQKIYPSARVLHWQGHSFRKGKRVPDFSLVKRITAKAVEIGETMVAIPNPTDIPDASVNRINLNNMEFEAEGFGIGQKTLKPGEITLEHSTGKNRELIFCLEGTLTVRKSDQPPVMLTPGEMTYIPSATRHEIKNLADKPAKYIFVFSQQLDTQTNKHRDD